VRSKVLRGVRMPARIEQARRCAFQGSSTLLSAYNLEPWCSSHNSDIKRREARRRAGNALPSEAAKR
jgi:hypothetical protein